MRRVDFSKTKIKGGFWAQKQELVKNETVWAVYKRFVETGRFDVFDFEHHTAHPHIFWDSDVAKWAEGVAYLAHLEPCPELEKIVDDLIDLIEKYQGDDGYFNIYHMLVEPDMRFTNRDNHELYCAGHLIEASVAYFEATGKRKFLELMIKYASYIEKRFIIDRDTPFTTPGHEEIELALVRLYECIGDEKYLNMARFFVDERGQRQEEDWDWASLGYSQAHLPVREQREAIGHAVRACYLYCAMADLAKICGDVSLKVACESIFDDIITRKMYITGGIGSSSAGEAFTIPYDLPNLIAYTESCAAIGLAFFAHRMLLIDNDSKYSNVIERALYNGFLSSTSLDGKSFFYTNPLEIRPELTTRDGSHKYPSVHFPITLRKEVFDCSCCPPNIVRFIPSVANFLYTCDDSTIYVHQFMESESEIDLGGESVRISQKTAYPYDGRVELVVDRNARIAIRVPDWCDSYEGETIKGYAYFNAIANEPIVLDFKMTPFFIGANPRVYDDCGKYAVQCGPIVYCMESIDNGEGIRDLHLDTSAEFTFGWSDELGVPTLHIDAYRRRSVDSLYYKRADDFYKTTATLIPYFAFANRGECEMQVWHFTK